MCGFPYVLFRYAGEIACRVRGALALIFIAVVISSCCRHCNAKAGASRCIEKVGFCVLPLTYDLYREVIGQLNAPLEELMKADDAGLAKPFTFLRAAVRRVRETLASSQA